MGSEDMARIIAESLARHQSRGLVDAANGLADVVIHGRADLLAVAAEVLDAAARPTPRSWGNWFARAVAGRQDDQRQARRRARLAERLEQEPNPVGAAITRLRLHELDR